MINYVSVIHFYSTTKDQQSSSSESEKKPASSRSILKKLFTESTQASEALAAMLVFSTFSAFWMFGTLTDRSVLQSGQTRLIFSHSEMHLVWKLCRHFRSFSFSPFLNSMQQMEQHSSSSAGSYFFSGMARMHYEGSPASGLVSARLAISWMRKRECLTPSKMVLAPMRASACLIASMAVCPNLRGSSSVLAGFTQGTRLTGALSRGLEFLSPSSSYSPPYSREVQVVDCARTGRDWQTSLWLSMRLRGYLVLQCGQLISRLAQTFGCESSSVSFIGQSQLQQGMRSTASPSSDLAVSGLLGVGLRGCAGLGLGLGSLGFCSLDLH